MKLNRRLSFVSTVCAVVIGIPAATASADEWYPPPQPEKKQHCNAGNGNGSDEVTFVEGEHCYGGDPGNSYAAGNRGGDEIPTSGGVRNPGGNNTPGP